MQTLTMIEPVLYFAVGTIHSTLNASQTLWCRKVVPSMPKTCVKTWKLDLMLKALCQILFYIFWGTNQSHYLYGMLMEYVYSISYRIVTFIRPSIIGSIWGVYGSGKTFFHIRLRNPLFGFTAFHTVLDKHSSNNSSWYLCNTRLVKVHIELWRCFSSTFHYGRMIICDYEEM